MISSISTLNNPFAQPSFTTETYYNKQQEGASSPLEHKISKRSTGEQRNCSHKPDVWILKDIKKYFREYAAGANDAYVNFNELKEAAGIRTTTRTFSPEATAAAKEILNRPELLRELDIGVNFFGFPGKKDERFDMKNIDYMIRKNETLGIPAVLCKSKYQL